MTVPAFLQWLIRRAHNGWNRWTLHMITGGRHPGMGWSAWAWRHRNTHIGGLMMGLIDVLFWPGHCNEESERISANLPLVIDWRTVWAFFRVVALLLLWPALLVWWLV